MDPNTASQLHTVHARFNPFVGGTISFQVEQGRSVSEIVASCPRAGLVLAAG